MTTEHMPGGLIGRSVRRVEDPVLITGKGCYVDDMQLPGMLHMTFLRSPYPHANILSIQTNAAQDAADAIAVEYTALPVVTNAEKALEPGAPLAREELDSNICYTVTRTGGDVDKAFAEAEHIVRLRIAACHADLLR